MRVPRALLAVLFMVTWKEIQPLQSEAAGEAYCTLQTAEMTRRFASQEAAEHFIDVAMKMEPRTAYDIHIYELIEL